jgi:type I restriction enzyme S subunit
VEKIEEQKKVMQQSLAKLEENFKALQQRAFRGHL